MKLTTLGCGKDPLKDSSLACHLLDLCQSRVLLECPLDLSALSLFLPASLSTDASARTRRYPGVTSPGSCVRKRSQSCTGRIVTATRGRKRERHSDLQRDSSLKPCTLAKRICRKDEEHGGQSLSGTGRYMAEVCGEPCPVFQESNGQVLANGEPWYKTAGLELVDLGLLDAVIISNPSGMLGLPFLIKHPDFCGKVYATKATAEIGELMMKELVLLHAGFTSSPGGPKPPWLNPLVLGTMPGQMRNSLLGRCFSNRANWQPLYSAEDIRDCIAQVQKLRFGEEVNIDGCLTVSPLSSGLGIGTSNWIISGGRQRMGYIAASLATPNHTMPMDITSLAGCKTLLISDVECPHETLTVVARKATSIRSDLGVKGQEVSECGVSAIEHSEPAIQSSSGSGSSQRLTSRTSGTVSSVAPRAGVSGVSVGVVRSGTPGQPMGVSSDKVGKVGSGGLVGRSDAASSDLRPEVSLACKGAIEALRRGGSVLVPASMNGLLLEFLDELGIQLGAANLKHIPVHYISPAAEEMLAYCNTVPEWLSSGRQEKLYAGESLFSYVDLVQEDRLHHSGTLCSPDRQKAWQEPCIVFAAHCSLRMGPAVDLLHRWGQNPLCLLILTETDSESELLLNPFLPLAMQVLEVPIASRLRSKEVVSLLQKIQPHVVLAPDFIQTVLEESEGTDTRAVLGYKKGRTVQVPNLETELEVNMSAELALQVQPKLVNPKKVAAAPIRADFSLRDGKLCLETPTSSAIPNDMVTSSRNYQCRWGEVSIGALLRALQERGLFDVFLEEPTLDDSSSVKGGSVRESKSLTVEIRSPSKAWIEIGPNSSHIKANEASLRHLIADAINCVLQVL